MKKLLPIIILSLLLTSCGKAEKKSDKLQVYTSFYAMNDFARTIGGEDIDLYNIVPAGTEPHDFEPTAADMAKLSKADVFIYNGAGMESWAEDIAETLPETVKVVCASEGLDINGSDPHVWLSTYNAQMQLQTIYKALSEADENGENDIKYLDRLTSYSSQIDELEQEYKDAGFDGKTLLVTHGGYNYLCAEFGMHQLALNGTSDSGEPTPAQMAADVEASRNKGVKTIFYDPIEGDKLAKAMANEVGIEMLPLYTFEGDSENRDYVTIMRFNLEQLKKGL